MDFKKNKIAKCGLALLCILLISVSASAALVPFAVTDPDGTDDSTSAYYTVRWTPQRGATVGIDSNMIKGRNTISCYADGDNSGYETTSPLFTSFPCCSDGNYLKVNIGDLGGRGANAEYYIWCINDQNSDQNAYSSGVLTLSRFRTNDMGRMSIDVAGGLVTGIANNATTIGIFVAIAIILMFLFDVLFDVFGIFKKVRELAGRR